MNLGVDGSELPTQRIGLAVPRAARGAIVAQAPLADDPVRRSAERASPDGWPSTLKFSRRMGEHRPDADYARAFHPPQRTSWAGLPATLAVLAVSLFAAWTLVVTLPH